MMKICTFVISDKTQTWKFAMMQIPKQMTIPITKPALLSLSILGSSGFKALTCLYRTYMVAIAVNKQLKQSKSREAYQMQ